MEKEGKANIIKFIVSLLFLSLLMMFFGSGLSIVLIAPNDTSVNVSVSRNINFTFNATWNANGELVGNCSLWTNFSSGVWAKALEFNGTEEGVYNESTANISNSSVSWVNYTFTGDVGKLAWSIACRNGTEQAAVLNFTTSNRTLTIDTAAPKVIQTEGFFVGFNTSSATPTITFNLTDANGTGVNMTSSGANVTVNVTIYVAGDNDPLVNFTLRNSSLTCDVSSDGVTSTQCTLNLATSTYALTNGTKQINITTIDRALWKNVTKFNFTVDNIPPVVNYFNITNSSLLNASANGGDPSVVQLGTSPGISRAQGNAKSGYIYVVANWTDNLTEPRQGLLQFWNNTRGAWETLNTTDVNGTTKFANPGWTNFTFKIPQGHNDFEGKNISFRVIVNDTLGNVNTSASVKNITIQVNDTTMPTLSVSLDLGSVQLGNRAVNGTNTSDTTPTIVWNVTDNSPIKYIAIQVDSFTKENSGCNLYQNYTRAGTPSSTTLHNSSMTILGPESSCNVLGNGTHTVRLTTEDGWSNNELYIFNFTVQTAEQLNITLGFINDSRLTSIVNKSNVTPTTGMLFNVSLDGSTITLKNVTWTSSCDSSSNLFDNASTIYPFNYSGCKGVEANQTVNVTAYDHTGNSNSKTYTFAVDDVAPTITLHRPTSGYDTSSLIEVNVSAFDQMSNIWWIGYFIDDQTVLRNVSINGSRLTDGQGQNVTFVGASFNVTPGTHTIRVSVNDTMGNVRNSSSFTFTYRGLYDFGAVNRSLRRVAPTNYTNITIYNSSRNIIGDTSTGGISVDQTLELFLILNTSRARINVTINFNGSAANWDKANFSIEHNESRLLTGIENNYTVKVIELISFNSSASGENSIGNFLTDSNSYYGFIDFTMNASKMNETAGGGSDTALGGIAELWYFSDGTKTNITECTGAYARTTTTPCWNNTLNQTVRVYVPQFSAVALVNETIPPNVSAVNYPQGSQSVSTFRPNISVSMDTAVCNYTYISANYNLSNTTMTLIDFDDRKQCYGSEINVANGTVENINISFYLWDGNDNLNVTRFYFNVTDSTPPNLTSVANGTTGSTTWTLTVTANESVNATVHRGTTVALAVTVNTTETDFAKSQSISLTSLSASTQYWFNVTICDKAGGCITNGTYTFTTSAAASTTTTTTTSSSGGGGGGGGAAAATDVADSQSQLWQTVPAESSFNLDIDKATIAITSAAVNNVKSELTNVDIEVAALTKNPVTTEAASKVYQYLRITKKNLADTDASSFKISFRVTKSWLDENGLASGDIALYRYKDVWDELTTRVVGTDATYVHYEADTPGFSSFAIGVKSGVLEEVPTPTPEATQTPVETPPTPVETPKPVEAPTKAPTAWIIAAIVIIIGIVLIVAYQKKKQ